MLLMHCRWCCNRGRQTSLVTAPSSTSSSFFSNSPVSNPASSTASATPPTLTSKAAELQQRLLVTLLTVVFYYYPSLMTTALSLFQCYRIDPVNAQAGQNSRLSGCTGMVMHMLCHCQCSSLFLPLVQGVQWHHSFSCCNKHAHCHQSQQQVQGCVLVLL